MARQLHDVEKTRRRLLADLAHEMRTLDAYLEGFEDGVATLNTDTVAMLRGQTRRHARLAEDISAVSRAEEHQLDLHPTPVRPCDVVHAAVGACAERYAEHRVSLDSSVPAALPLACAGVLAPAAAGLSVT